MGYVPVSALYTTGIKSDQTPLKELPLMKNIAQKFRNSLFALIAVSLPLTALAEHHEGDEPKVRAVSMALESKVVDVDMETHQLSLKGPAGNIVTLTIREEVANLENIKVGDTVITTYMAAMESELREPTAEELAEPWVVVEEGGRLEKDTIGGARVIRAVCTLEGMNRQLGTVTLKDSRGKLHLIGDVEPEKMEGVTVGQTVVVLYAEALALTLEHKASAE
jgi:hypothetical protein